MILVAMVTQ